MAFPPYDKDAGSAVSTRNTYACGLFSKVRHSRPGGNTLENGETDTARRRDLVISFAGLQRMRLRKLQIGLANRVVGTHFRGEEPSDWENLLKEYSRWSLRWGCGNTKKII